MRELAPFIVMFIGTIVLFSGAVWQLVRQHHWHENRRGHIEVYENYIGGSGSGKIKPLTREEMIELSKRLKTPEWKYEEL